MLLVGSGNNFVRDLEQSGALALAVPPEGGSEGHYQRRVRGAGYGVVHMSARGLGDLASYFTRTHGVCPAHLGKSERRTYFFPPLIDQYVATLPQGSKGVVFWLIEGNFLTRQEWAYLAKLASQDSRVKFVVEARTARVISWQPLAAAVAA